MSRFSTDPATLAPALLVLLVMGVVVLLQRRRLSRLAERARQLKMTLEERSQQLEKANLAIRDVAHVDPMTGIANHRTFQDELKLQWRRTARSRLPMTLLMIDVDGLKHYNDNKGQQAGDECLRRIAETLRGQLQRPGDIVSRYGGDEFGVLLPETDAAGGVAVAERMRQAVEDLDLTWGSDLSKQRITLSVGVATTVPSPQELATSLVATADRALAVAKRNGRNRVAT